MIINRNSNFIDGWFWGSVRYLCNRGMERSANYLVKQKHEMIRAAVICSVLRTLLDKKKLSHGDISFLRVMFPILRNELNVSIVGTFYIWDVLAIMKEHQLKMKYFAEAKPVDVIKKLTVGELFDISALLFNALPHKLQFEMFQHDIAAVVSELVAFSTNPEVKAGVEPIADKPILFCSEGQCSWVKESRENGWQSYCRVCKTKAQGSCQG